MQEKRTQTNNFLINSEKLIMKLCSNAIFCNLHTFVIQYKETNTTISISKKQYSQRLFF